MVTMPQESVEIKSASRRWSHLFTFRTESTSLGRILVVVRSNRQLRVVACVRLFLEVHRLQSLRRRGAVVRVESEAMSNELNECSAGGREDSVEFDASTFLDLNKVRQVRDVLENQWVVY